MKLESFLKYLKNGILKRFKNFMAVFVFQNEIQGGPKT